MRWLCCAVGAAALTVACAQERTGSPTTPTPPPPQTPTAPRPTSGPHAISGAVVEITPQGVRRLESVSVSAWVREASFGYSYMWARGALATNAAGEFELTALPASVTVQLQVWKEGYVQQCAVPEVTVPSGARLEAQVVSLANLSASPDSVPPPAAGFRSVSGVILERTANGTRPVAGAGVDYEPIGDFPAALTFSDSSGRYLLCGLPDDRTITIGAGQGGRFSFVSVPPGRSTGADITLP